ncbi:MAG: ribonuclease III [Mollicutes bacterium PWAP]|nr:ribonuclease III [Mollicutes bacterium PWAP]
MHKIIYKLAEEFNFKVNDKLFKEAFTHKSLRANRDNIKTYERLEFLGDAILQKEVSIFLFRKYPNKDEGELTRMRINLVDNFNLGIWAHKLKLNLILKKAKDLEFNKNSKIWGDLFESLIGAIYINEGHIVVRNILKKTILSIDNIKENKNPKTLVQEYLMSEFRGNVEYVISEFDDKFKALLIMNGFNYGEGIGKTKKEAEINAAISAIKKYKIGEK